jgi:hypothetical protein
VVIEFRVVEQPSMFPGMSVDRSSDGPCVDTHFEFLDGRVYLSERTVYQAAMTGIVTRADYLEGIAERYGMLTSEQAHSLRLERDMAQQAQAIAEGELAELQPLAVAVASASRKFQSPDEPVRARAPRKTAA